MSAIIAVAKHVKARIVRVPLVMGITGNEPDDGFHRRVY